MKWLLRACLFICCACLVSSCAFTSSFHEFEELKIESVQEAKAATKLMLDGWLFRSGVIHGALEPIKHEMPQQTLTALAELDVLAQRYHTEGGLSDQDLGRALGLRLQMIGGIIQAVIDQYAPELLRYFPMPI